MLSATSDWSHASSRMRSAIFLARGMRAYAVERSGLLYDSRFACSTGPAQGVASLYLVRSGTFHATGSAPVRGRSAWALRESELERVEPGARTFRAYGDPYASLAMVVPEDAIVGPLGIDRGALVVGDATWAAVDALLASFGSEHREKALIAVLDGLARDGHLARSLVSSIRDDVEAASLQRLWRAIARRFSEQDTSVHVDLFATLAGMSSRQVVRELGDLVRAFPFFGTFRSTVKTLRLRRAVLLLSAQSLGVSDVAKIVGYGSADAMGRAFRDAGLPPPSVVRDAVANVQPAAHH